MVNQDMRDRLRDRLAELARSIRKAVTPDERELIAAELDRIAAS